LTTFGDQSSESDPPPESGVRRRPAAYPKKEEFI
jgi:hypothetical protein